ncbi:MAG: methylmalonyl Co-A mutase-associated GTPase MeaB [Thermoplasmata archaeon]|nr:MAG: methylmalonyl Co-A mutase-associated GTPase MeaB [Thermoplasmata archaeon]
MKEEIVSKVLEGDSRAIARMITLVENHSKEASSLMKEIHRYTGSAHIIGVTGVMGSGKSTLIAELTRLYRKNGKKVGIIAIDPTSPFSGGALLGDRVRMTELILDKEVFIRSMGTRGMLGGLAGAVYDVVEILDASGKDVILVETVGVGQAEVDIIKIADTTVVVIVPGLGDSVQTMKAGVMEIADIYVVNKADHPGIDQTVMEIENLVELSSNPNTPIIKTIAKTGEGVSDLLEAISQHQKYLETEGELEEKRKIRYEAELIEIIRNHLLDMIYDESIVKQRIDTIVDRILSKETDPYTAAEEILGRILK